MDLPYDNFIAKNHQSIQGYTLVFSCRLTVILLKQAKFGLILGLTFIWQTSHKKNTMRVRAPVCEICDMPMTRAYIRPVCEDGKQRFAPVGWWCPGCMSFRNDD
jgi:hypothetical protein